MKKECLSCRNAFRFYDGACNCFLESSFEGINRHNDDYWCLHYDAVDETSYDERVAWKQRQEREKEILKK